MSFRLVPKSVTLNDLERRNGRYFALFQRIWVPSGRTAQKFTFAISSPDEFLLGLPIIYLRWLAVSQRFPKKLLMQYFTGRTLKTEWYATAI